MEQRDVGAEGEEERRDCAGEAFGGAGVVSWVCERWVGRRGSGFEFPGEGLKHEGCDLIAEAKGAGVGLDLRVRGVLVGTCCGDRGLSVWEYVEVAIFRPGADVNDELRYG